MEMEGVEKSNDVGLLPMLPDLFSAANSEASPKLNVLGVFIAPKLKSVDCFDSSFVFSIGNMNRDDCDDGAAACASDGDANECDCPVFDSSLVVAAEAVEVKGEVETEVVQEFIELIVGGGFQDMGRVAGSGGEVGRSHCDVPDEAAW